MSCVVCNKVFNTNNSSLNKKCLLCPLRFCKDCADIRLTCDSCYKLYGELCKVKKFKSKL